MTTQVRIGRSLPLPPGIIGEAEFSEDGRYRFWLLRIWAFSKPTLVVIATNPSSAGANRDDITIRVLENMAVRFGFGRLIMLNSDPLVSTDYGAVLADTSDMGRRARYENNRAILNALQEVRLSGLPGATVLPAWGNVPTPRHMWLQDVVLNCGLSARCLGMTHNGRPRHPLRTQSRELYPYPFVETDP